MESLDFIVDELIKNGMENSRYFRPNTHDLMQDELEMFEIKVLMVKIESFHEGTYYSKLILQQNNKILNLDSRPSDAISIAVRFGSPIYIKDDLMKQFGKNIC
jgi:bifunctional DNase/RNase